MSEGRVILVVEDEELMREFISEFLIEQGYRVHGAEDADAALHDILPHTAVDMIITDINMPGMKGYELLDKVRQQYPDVIRVLMTAYNIEDYLDIAFKHSVENIFAKTTPLNTNELSRLVRTLLAGDIFGIGKHFDAPPVQYGRVTSPQNIEKDVTTIMQRLPDNAHNSKFKLVLYEIMVNALFYGATSQSPTERDSWDFEFKLPEDHAVQVEYACDHEKYGVSITDYGGKLTKNDVLYWLSRQRKAQDGSEPDVLFESHGRGLFISRNFIDRMIINIERGKRTEIILMNYREVPYKGFKPLYINEI
jgi:CheY-like chemotaxis protein